MNTVTRCAVAFALSLFACGVLQQAIMIGTGETNTSFALVPLAVIVLLVALIFGAVVWRRRTARAIGWTAASMLAFALVFGVAVFIFGVNTLSPGIGGNIGYLIATLVVFYFLVPAAMAVPIHWLMLRGAAEATRG